MGSPPFETGAVQDTIIFLPENTAARIEVGASGTVACGVTGSVGAEVGPAPKLLEGVTMKV